jgi:alpha-L-fucosidase
MADMELHYGDHVPSDTKGAQRLSVERLKQWQALEYGMFIHYGLVTYNHDLATISPSDFRPPGPVDTDQWIRVARDAGMKYAIWITQHSCSFCTWPTKLKGAITVMDSPMPGDIVRSFVDSCHKYGIVPCLYYSLSRFTPIGRMYHIDHATAYATRQALDDVKRQLDEILTQYGDIAELWLDGGRSYGVAGRPEIYEHATAIQPNMVFTFNGWGSDQWRLPRFHTLDGWPSDIQTLEVLLPPFGEISPWRKMTMDQTGRKLDTPVDMYIPVGSYMIMQRNFNWFHDERAQMVSDADLLGMRLICKARNANLVLNVAPDRTSRIPDDQVAALMRLRDNYEGVAARSTVDAQKTCR